MKSINLIKSVLMMMAMSIVCGTFFTSCGGNDDEDSPDGGGGSTTIGVHRIDVQIDGKTNSDWLFGISFLGMTADGKFTGLYENGKKLADDSQVNTWATDVIRDFSVSTDKNAATMVGTVTLGAPVGSKAAENVTITMVGYVNNNRIYTRVFTLPAGKSNINISFSTGDGGKSECSVDGTITQ